MGSALQMYSGRDGTGSPGPSHRLVALSTTKRGDELTRTLLNAFSDSPTIAVLCSASGVKIALRGGIDQTRTVPYDDIYPATCPVRVMEQWVAVGTPMGVEHDTKLSVHPKRFSNSDPRRRIGTDIGRSDDRRAQAARKGCRNPLSHPTIGGAGDIWGHLPRKCHFKSS